MNEKVGSIVRETLLRIQKECGLCITEIRVEWFEKSTLGESVPTRILQDAEINAICEI